MRGEKRPGALVTSDFVESSMRAYTLCQAPFTRRIGRPALAQHFERPRLLCPIQMLCLNVAVGKLMSVPLGTSLSVSPTSHGRSYCVRPLSVAWCLPCVDEQPPHVYVKLRHTTVSPPVRLAAQQQNVCRDVVKLGKARRPSPPATLCMFGDTLTVAPMLDVFLVFDPLSCQQACAWLGT